MILKIAGNDVALMGAIARPQQADYSTRTAYLAAYAEYAAEQRQLRAAAIEEGKFVAQIDPAGYAQYQTERVGGFLRKYWPWLAGGGVLFMVMRKRRR